MKISLYNFKQSWCDLKKRLGFMTTIVVTMGVTTGAFLCISTLNYLLFFKPFDYPTQEQLYVAKHNLLDPDGNPRANAFSYPALVFTYENEKNFSNATIISYRKNVVKSIVSHPIFNSAYITPEYFSIFGVELTKGRSFNSQEDLNTFLPVAIISYDTWLKYFNLDDDILEQKVTIGGVNHEIIGVTAPNFNEPQLSGVGVNTQIWLPWDYNTFRPEQRKYWGDVNNSLFFVGRLKNKLDLSDVERELSNLVNNRWIQEGIASGWTISIQLTHLKDVLLGNSKIMAILLLCGVTGLLLIAIVNLINLFMSRTAEKQGVLSIHASLGAKKFDLFKLMFSETSILMGISMALALIIAGFGLALLKYSLNDLLPRANELEVSIFTCILAVVACLLLSIIFAQLSTNIVNYKKLIEKIQGSGKGSGVQVSKKRRQVLIISQTSLAVVLTIASINLFYASFKTIFAPKGFKLNNTLQLTIRNTSGIEINGEESKSLMTELKNKLDSLPEIIFVSQAKSPVYQFDTWAMKELNTNQRLTPLGRRVDQHYFNLIDQKLLAGRTFDLSDIQSKSNVMIVNEAFANMYGGANKVIGRKFTRGQEAINIVGVVSGISLPNNGEDTPRVYMPVSESSHNLIVKYNNSDQILSRETVSEIVQNVDTRITIFSYDMLESLYRKLLFNDIVAAIISAALTVLILFLAGIGLFGTINYNVQLRKLELGTRLSIGAKNNNLYKLIILDTFYPLLTGLLIGLIACITIYLSLENILRPYLSLTTFVLAILTLVLISMISILACCYPVRNLLKRPIISLLKNEE